jgi:hypothetical protein
MHHIQIIQSGVEVVINIDLQRVLNLTNKKIRVKDRPIITDAKAK